MATSREPPSGSLMADFAENESRASRDSWDYAVLEIIRRQDWFALLGFGAVRLAKSVMKLGCNAMIYTPNQKPTFDEREHMQVFLDSPELRAYRSNLRKVVTPPEQTFFDEVVNTTCFKIFEVVTGAYLSPDAEIKAKDAKAFECVTKPTSAGRDRLEERSAQTRRIYDEIRNMYGQDEFYERARKHESELPLMVAMGMSGAAMEAMLVASDAQYAFLLRVSRARMHAGFDGASLDGPDAYTPS